MGNSVANPVQKKEPDDEDRCPICMEKAMVRPHSLRPCCHVLCQQCLFQMLNYRSQCPLCNGDIDSWVFVEDLDRQIQQKYPVEYQEGLKQCSSHDADAVLAAHRNRLSTLRSSRPAPEHNASPPNLDIARSRSYLFFAIIFFIIIFLIPNRRA